MIPRAVSYIAIPGILIPLGSIAVSCFSQPHNPKFWLFTQFNLCIAGVIVNCVLMMGQNLNLGRSMAAAFSLGMALVLLFSLPPIEKLSFGSVIVFMAYSLMNLVVYLYNNSRRTSPPSVSR